MCIRDRIIAGVYGMSLIVNQFYIDLFLILSAICLFIYGIIRLKNIFRSAYGLNEEVYLQKNFRRTMLTMIIFTLLNPHVYLDTVVLIGTMAMKFVPYERMLFAAGAALASFVFFFSLAYGARLLAPRMKNQIIWKILDLMIAVIMFSLAFGMLIAGGWFK